MRKLNLFVLALAVLALAAVPAFAQDTITIVFSHAFTDENRSSWVQEVADAYMEANPNVQIELRTNPSYRDTLNSAFLGAQQGEAPHIVQVFEVGSQEAFDSGVFIPVSSVASEEQLAGLEDIVEPVRNYYSLGDEQWSLPWNSSNPVLYYNKTLWEAAGLTEEDVPQTYGEVLAVCETVMGQQEELGVQACMGWNMHSWFVEQWVAQQGALLANNDNGRTDRPDDVLLDSDAMLNIFNWWSEMAENGYYAYTGSLEDWNGSDALFTGQQVIMHVTSTADLVNINNAAVENGFELGTGLLPIADDAERNGVVVGGASIWLTDGHPQEELEAAVDFMLFLGNTENGVTWHQRTGYFPIRLSSIDQLEAEGWFDENPAFRTAFEQLTSTQTNYATAGAILGTFLETRTIIEEAAQAVVDAGVDPAEALAEADMLADEALALYNEDIAAQ